MKKYDDSLVKKIHHSGETVSMYGTDIHLKESPTRAGKGYMDPVELDIMKQNWAANEEEGSNPFQQQLPPDQMVAFLRDMMGFANLNLNEKEIITKYETIREDGHTIGLWRYFLRRGNQEPKSCLIYIHGGGWLGGSVYAVENPCRFIAELADAVVFNVDYNLAPEVKFPGNLNECYAAVKHIYEHAEEYGIDRTKISVAGDSAGGNLCAAMSLKDRDEGNHFISQEILLYPAVTFGRNAPEGYTWTEDVYEAVPEQKGPIFGSLMLGRPGDLNGSLEAVCYFKDMKDASHPYASPMMAESHAGLPKTIIMTAEYDGLRQQGEFYGAQLAGAGVDTTIYRYCGCTHAFLDRLGYQPQTEEACRVIAEAL